MRGQVSANSRVGKKMEFFMRIKYIVSTMVFWWREHHMSFEQECEFLRHLGFGVEIWPTMKGNNDCRFVRRNWSRLKEATRDMLVVLASRNDGPTLQEWDEQIQCAKMLDASIVTDLQGLCVSSGLGVADWGFAKDVLKIADDNDVTVSVETGPLRTLLKIGEKFDNVKYCLDTGFANIDNGTPFTEYVDSLAERTVHLHLTDNYGRIDDHEPPGVRGGMRRKNWNYLLETLNKYDNDVIGSLEMFPCMPGTMIRQGSRFMFDVLGWPNRPQALEGYDETAYRPI